MMDWIARLDLQAHPEGGWFRRIYTDPRRVDTAYGERAAASSIHYLLNRQSPVGHLHRNRSTILHYLQDGGPVEYLLLDRNGSLRSQTLGLAENQSLFLEVPGLHWKGSRLIGEATHALVSEVVIPGFDYADHGFMTLEILTQQFPQHLAELRSLLSAPMSCAEVRSMEASARLAC